MKMLDLMITPRTVVSSVIIFEKKICIQVHYLIILKNILAFYF